MDGSYQIVGVKEKLFNADNCSVLAFFHFGPGHQLGFLFSAHLFPSAKNVNLDLLFPLKNTPKSARSEPLRTHTFQNP